jgi:hypothetical protein
MTKRSSTTIADIEMLSGNIFRVKIKKSSEVDLDSAK